jgi:hypothetical protein
MMEDHHVMSDEQFLLFPDVDSEIRVGFVKVVEGHTREIPGSPGDHPVHPGFLEGGMGE